MNTKSTTYQPINTADMGKHTEVTQPSGTANTAAATDTALAKFDSLPDAAHVRLPVVKGLFACSSATVWRRVKSGEIPAPKRFGGRISAWNVGELRHRLSDVGAAA